MKKSNQSRELDALTQASQKRRQILQKLELKVEDLQAAMQNAHEAAADSKRKRVGRKGK